MPEKATADTTTGSVRGLAPERPVDGIVRRTIVGRYATVAVYEFAPHAEFPLHRHEQEQTTLVESGQARFVSADADVVLEAGEWSMVAPGVPHRVIAGPDGARFVAVIAPARAGDAYDVLGDPAA